jgi:hypothetical protein
VKLDRLLELAGLVEDRSSYDLQAKYRHFNDTLFGGELPDIPVVWGKMKGVGGTAHAKIIWPPGTPRPNPMLVRLGRVDRHHGAVLDRASLRIKISDLYKRSTDQIDGLLIHEMIHIFFFVTGRYGENHGPLFLAKLRELSQLSGIKVPLTDDVEGLDPTDSATKTVGVIAAERKDRSFGFRLVNPKLLQNQAEVEKHVTRIAASSGYLQVKACLVNSPEWTKAALKYPVGRSFEKLGSYRMSPELAEELKGAKVVFSISAEEASKRRKAEIAAWTDEYNASKVV